MATRFETTIVAFGLAGTLAACSSPAETENLPPRTAQSAEPTAATTKAAGAQASSSPHTEIVDPQRQNNNEFVVYVPTWLEDAKCLDLQNKLPGGKATRLIISFALPTAEGTVEPPRISPVCAAMVRAIGSKSQVSLAIGGWGVDDTAHLKILENFNIATRNPAKFATSAANALQNVSKAINLPVTGIDLDWEYPTAESADGLTAMVGALRQQLPNAKLSMAVAADGTTLSIDSFAKNIDSFNVMTYDKDGPWSAATGDIAPADWTVASITTWAARVGNPRKIVVGYPAYGYRYPGSTKRGDSFDKATAAAITLNMIPPSAFEETASSDGARAAIVDGAWTSLVSPDAMKQTQAKLLKTLPDLGGAMIWSAEGATPAVFDALQSAGQ